MKKYLLLAIALSLVLAVSSCSSGAEKTAIKIGFATAVTGPGADYGRMMSNGASLAAKEINAAGGINGRLIELVIQDDRQDTKEAANVAKSFAVGDVVAVIGHVNTPCCQAAGPTYEEAKIPYIIASASNPALPELGEYVFQMAPNSPEEVQAGAVYLYRDCGIKTIVTTYENDDFGKAAESALVTAYEKLGGKVLSREAHLLTDTDFTVMLTKVKSLNPECMFVVTGYAPGAQMLRQAKNMDFGIPIVMTSGSAAQGLIDIAKDAAEGVVHTNVFHTASTAGKAKAFIDAYTKEYQTPPGGFEAMSYDAVYLLCDAMRSAKIENMKTADARTAIRDALLKVKDYEMVTGKVSCSSVGYFGPHRFYTTIIKDGKFTYQGSIEQ